MHNIIPDNQESPHSHRTLEGIAPVSDPLKQIKKRKKPQIESIPGISPKESRRYRVKLGDVILATNLTSDEALELAKQGVQS
jgi:hypothetical protein